MANELKAALSSLTFAKAGAQSVSIPASMSVTVAGKYSIHTTQNIGTGDETLDLGAVGTIGFAFFRNLGPTNFVIIGEDGSSYPVKLKLNEWALTRWNGAAVHAKADTAAIDLEYCLIET